MFSGVDRIPACDRETYKQMDRRTDRHLPTAYASRHQFLVPRYQLSSLGRRSFAVAGPTIGIHCRLTSVIRHVVTSLSDVHWKHSCSLSTSVSSALEVFYDDALYKSALSIYLSIYLSVYAYASRGKNWWIASLVNYTESYGKFKRTRSSAVAERPRDALCRWIFR